MKYRTQIVGERIEKIYTVVVHRFTVTNSEDPEIYAAKPIIEWEKSDPGMFVMENSVTQPAFHKSYDVMTFGYMYIITAELEEKKLSEFYLRWGNSKEEL